jgi:predicted ribosome quality control (RQC) complex YloA/Tae2 family protein
MKKAMSNVDVAAVVAEVKDKLIGARAGKAYQQSAETVWLAIQSAGEGRTDLILEAGRRLHITSKKREGPKIPPQFPAILRKYLMGGWVEEISQHDFDRVLEIVIQKGEDRFLLVVELFPKGNIVLLDESRRIILPLRPMVLRGRRMLAGETYHYHEGQPDPRSISKGDLSALLSGSDTDLVRTLVRGLNMGGIYGEEVCLRAGIDKNTPAPELDEEKVGRIHKALSQVFSLETLKPHIVYRDGEPLDVVPTPLLVYEGLERKDFASFSDALDAYFVEKVVEPGPTALERRRDMQKEAIGEFLSKEKEFMRTGEMVYEHYATIENILTAISSAREKGYSYAEIWDRIKGSNLPEAQMINSIDYRAEVKLSLEEVDLELNAELSVPQNAERYYERAKEMTKKREGAKAALETTLKLIEKKASPERKTRKKVRPRKQRWYERFRWFESSDGFLVIGGRDAQTNEELYSKYLEKRDLAIHTDAPGAPLVVIKTMGEEIPEETLEEAAQFAVSYSSVWKAGMYAGDCYVVKAEQVTKTPEHGEYIKKGSFVMRGERRYFKNVPVGIAVGITDDKLIGGPPSAVKPKASHVVEVEPGEYNADDMAKRIYRLFAERVKERKFLKSIASPDQIVRFLPPGGSRMKG